MDFFKRPIFLLLFVIALSIALVVSYLNRRSREESAKPVETEQSAPQIINLTNVDAADFDSEVKEELDLANAKALEYGADYKLSAVIYELNRELQPNVGLSRYVYSSEKDSQNNWTITISQKTNSYVRAAIPKTDYVGAVSQINTNYWKFNYVTALQMAEKNGGLEWREKNSLKGVKLTLSHTPPKNWLTWRVEYQGESVNLTKTIDANSGEIVDESTTSSQ